jgi:OmpA-OmpF porin, OOP family
LDANGNTYATFFNTIDAATSSKSETLKKLKAGMDGVYETNAEAPAHSVSANFFAGMGITVRIKSKFTVGIEYYLILTNSDLLDGQRWQEYALGDPVLTRDKDRIENLSLNIGYRY